MEHDREAPTLVIVTGHDHPGITAALVSALAVRRIPLLDMQQVVVQGRLHLSILVAATGAARDGDPAALVAELRAVASEHGCDLESRILEPEAAPPRLPYVLTLLGEPQLEAEAVAGIAAALARHGVNIEKIQRLSEARFATLEMTIGMPDEPTAHAVRAELVQAAARFDVDFALQAEGLFRRAKRLVVFDLDSTLVRGETIDALATRAGVSDRVAAITRRAMNSEIDYAEALRERVALLAGLPASALEEAAAAAELMPGAMELVAALRRLGFETAIVSGGFAPVAEALRARLGIDWAYANELETASGRLTGRVHAPLLDGAAKARILRELAARRGIAADQVIAVGDGANDLPMLEAAGLGIAFNAHAAVRARAQSLLNRRLDAVLFLLGISERDMRSLQEREAP